MASGKMTLKVAMLTSKELEELIQRVILETKVAPLVQKEVDRIVKRKSRTTLRKER